MNDIRNIKQQLQKENKFDLILMDPPWENKHVKRTLKRRKLQSYTSDTIDGDKSDNTYEMLENGAIGNQLPIPELLKDNGYEQYEISAFSKQNHACEHNLNYWEFGDYLGVGCGASGKITTNSKQVIRTEKVKHPKGYLEAKNNYGQTGFILACANFYYP